MKNLLLTGLFGLALFATDLPVYASDEKDNTATIEEKEDDFSAVQESEEQDRDHKDESNSDSTPSIHESKEGVSSSQGTIKKEEKKHTPTKKRPLSRLKKPQKVKKLIKKKLKKQLKS